MVVNIIPKQTIINKIGATIKKISKKKGISINDVSRKSTCAKMVLEKLEGGYYTSMPTLSTLSNIESAIDVSKGTLKSILERAIGKRIKYLRNQHGISQQYLAHHVNMSKSHVEDLELGYSIIKPKEVVELVHFFHVNGNFIICRSNTPSIKQYPSVRMMNISRRPQDKPQDVKSNKNPKDVSKKSHNYKNIGLHKRGHKNMKYFNISLQDKPFHFKLHDKRGRVIMRGYLNITQLATVINAMRRNK